MRTDSTRVVGVLLAGGLARRMGGGDKGLKSVGGTPILERVVRRVAPQVERLVLNANGDPERFGQIPYLAGLPVAADTVPDFAGPLAGILAALEWAAVHAPDATDVVSVPTDCPFLPRDLVSSLVGARDGAGAQLACARSGAVDGEWQTHPVVGLWPVVLRDELRHAMVGDNMRKIDRWTARYPLAYADFGTDPADPFFNANALEDLAEADALARRFPDL